MSAGGRSEKTPKIRGLVKRCRSFKEDLMSRLARKGSHNSETSPGHGSRHGKSPSPSDWSKCPSPVKGKGNRTGDNSSEVPFTNRIKEAYLTLQFVESLIQKKCISLLGGSTNVFLDLMGNLLDEVKKSSSESGYHSVISHVKSTLSNFLESVDVLLLKDGLDEAEQAILFEKVLEELNSIRTAITRLKALIEAKENNAVGLHNTSTPTKKSPSKLTVNDNNNKSTHSSNTNIDPNKVNPFNDDKDQFQELQSTENFKENQELQRPPLPPKLKHWTRTTKSFDMGLLGHGHDQWVVRDTPSPPTNRNSQSSLLNKWLEQNAANNPNLQLQIGHNNNNNNQYQYDEKDSSSSAKSGSEREVWTESSIYVVASSSSSITGGGGCVRRIAKMSSSGMNVNIVGGGGGGLGGKHRTYSDSYQIQSRGSQDSLLECVVGVGTSDLEENRSNTTHSLSLGSSLDNLLLVDNSAGSNLSPNSSCENNRVSVSSTGNPAHSYFSNNQQQNPTTNPNNNGGSGQQLAELSNFDPDADVFDESPPPELPQKTVKRHFLLGPEANSSTSEGGGNNHHNINQGRCPSPYDNVDVNDTAAIWRSTSNFSQQQQHQHHPHHPHFMSFSESRNTLVGYLPASGGSSFDYTTTDEKPPLPPKKKHSIAAYVELLNNFDSCHPIASQFQGAHLLQHAHNQYYNNHNQNAEAATIHNPNYTNFTPSHLPINTRASYSYHQFSYGNPINNTYAVVEEELLPGNNGQQNKISPSSPSKQIPPALPPKKSRNYWLRHSISEQGTYSDPHHHHYQNHHRLVRNSTPITTDFQPPQPPNFSPPNDSPTSSHSPHNKNTNSNTNTKLSPVLSPGHNNNISGPAATSPSYSSIIGGGGGGNCDSPSIDKSFDESTLEEHLYLLDSSNLLLMTNNSNSKDNASSKNSEKSENTSSSTSNSNSNSASSSSRTSEGPEVKGGDPHVLLCYACNPDLKEKKFREVFLLTYRNFIRPSDVVSLLWKRYQYFTKKSDRTFAIHSKATLELFVDVVNSLTPMDLDEEMINKVRNCFYHLINCGEIRSALKARKGLITKYEVRSKLLAPKPAPVSLSVTTETHTLLEWGATSIAQQMTCLDSELFRQLEPAELLLWAREQTEEFCPALNYFTEHFNKVSYWARSKVLLCGSASERNRTMKKLIEVMRKLREYNNFNSLLAILAALDSAPIRRLGFSRRLTEALKPHALLTDSTGSFRAYRQVLAESKPPCIPYIGLVLQDLTFVHIGNVDFLPDGKVNWVKRWQQWLVLEPIRRFHACNYGFVRNDNLLAFLNNFDESLNDDDLWALSESIKPRGKS